MKNLNKIQRINAMGGINNDNPTEPTREDFDNIITLLSYDDYKTTGQKNPDTYGYSPVTDSWYAIISEIMIPSIENIFGFIYAHHYPNQIRKLRQEFGIIGNARIIVTKNNMLLHSLSYEDQPIYGIEFTNDLKCKGHIVLACTI